jgi:hypothetical protein
MPSNQACSKSAISPLVRLFVERSRFDPTTKPDEVMAGLIERVRRERRRRKLRNQIQLFLDERRINRIELLSDLSCDGLIEPTGHVFVDGFRMLLKRSSAEPRMRFTIAHEICHTFFYELVPEIKFVPHDPDEQEERLCNFGAAALLIPPHSLKRRAAKLPVSLESLQCLAEDYTVSLPTMALRLRALDIWRCQFSRWRRMLNGTFVLDRLYGGKQADWKWADESILATAWDSTEPHRGHSFVSYEDDHGVRRYKPVSYQVRKSLDGVTALWGSAVATKMSSSPPSLFGPN